MSVTPDTTDEQQSVSLAASVERGFTPEDPARLTIELTNTSATETEWLFGQSPPFSQYTSDGSPSIFLIPDSNDHIGMEDDSDADRIVPAEPHSGCWRLDAHIIWSYMGNRRTLKPDETIAESYTLLDGPAGGCLPSGDYRFVEDNYFGDEQSWGMTVEIS